MKKAKKQQERIVLVKAVDLSGQGGWHLVRTAKEAKLIEVELMGWVIEETEEVLTLAAGRDIENETVSDRNTIPKANILSITELRRGKK